MRQKPVVTISLLPLHWGEPELLNIFGHVVAAARAITGMYVESEDDIIVLFPTDRMVKGTGAEIDIHVHVSDEITNKALENFVRLVFGKIQEVLPQAQIQTRTNRASNIAFFTTRR